MIGFGSVYIFFGFFWAVLSIAFEALNSALNETLYISMFLLVAFQKLVMGARLEDWLFIPSSGFHFSFYPPLVQGNFKLFGRNLIHCTTDGYIHVLTRIQHLSSTSQSSRISPLYIFCPSIHFCSSARDQRVSFVQYPPCPFSSTVLNL